jgi:hypothetical protein
MSLCWRRDRTHAATLEFARPRRRLSSRRAARPARHGAAVQARSSSADGGIVPLASDPPRSSVRTITAPIERPPWRINRATASTCDSDAIRSVPWGKPRGRAVRAPPLGSGWIVPGGVNPLATPFGEGNPLAVDSSPDRSNAAISGLRQNTKTDSPTVE